MILKEVLFDDILDQKREAPAGEKPEPVRTHLRNMIIVPEMIGSIIGVYNGKTFNQVEIKPEMIGHYLAEFSISYKPVKHGRPGIGATHSSRFIPLKWDRNWKPKFFVSFSKNLYVDQTFVCYSSCVLLMVMFCWTLQLDEEL